MVPFLRIAGITLIIGFAVVGLVFSAVFIAMQFGLLNVRGTNAVRNQFFLGSTATTTVHAIRTQPCVDSARTTCMWNETPEWSVVSGGLTKDAAIIARVSAETGVPARLIATVVVPEQLRFFTAEREVFKRYFEPLKILGSLSQFSLGVSGIKQATAKQIEEYAHNPASPFYPGPAASALLTYEATTTPHDTLLYNRLTDEKNHYYSYLYTALAIKELEAQWAAAGFPIENRPDIVATLFNIGFEKSFPKADAAAGGAPISIGGTSYAFGELGGLFYASEELSTVFPR